MRTSPFLLGSGFTGKEIYDFSRAKGREDSLAELKMKCAPPPISVSIGLVFMEAASGSGAIVPAF